MKSDWIPVTSGLKPERNKDGKTENVQITYLSFTSKKPQCDVIAYLDEYDDWCWSLDDSSVSVDVVAWRPLDEPYVPDSNNLSGEIVTKVVKIKQVCEIEAVISGIVNDVTGNIAERVIEHCMIHPELFSNKIISVEISNEGEKQNDLSQKDSITISI